MSKIILKKKIIYLLVLVWLSKFEWK